MFGKSIYSIWYLNYNFLQSVVAECSLNVIQSLVECQSSWTQFLLEGFCNWIELLLGWLELPLAWALALLLSV